MRCWNCGFENIPGLGSCARCTSTLNLNGADVEPPRASRWRTFTFMDRLFYRLGAWLGHVWEGLRRVPQALEAKSSVPALLLSIVPGLGHSWIKRRRLGWVIFGVWFAFLVLTVLSIGTEWNWLFVGGMIGTHSFAVISILGTDLSLERLRTRVLFGLLLGAAMWFFLYGPAGRLATRFYQPMPLAGGWQGEGLIAPSDWVLSEGPWLRPPAFRRGDVVVYTINSFSGRGYFIAEGLGLDRIVAVPGDHVQIAEGVLLVNGCMPPPGESPLGEVPHYVAIDIQVPEGQYVVLPTRLALRAGAHGIPREVPQDVFSTLSVCSSENVLGRVILRIRPWSRFGRLQ
jgi:hypothetical protein